MKILFLTKYGQLGASSRYRFYQFFDGYQANNLNCTSSPFFNDRYLQSKYKNKKTPVAWVLWAFLKRFFALLTVFRYDLVVIEKELFPYFPAWPERLLSLLGKKYIVDYDDALFHQYDQHSSKWVRKFLGNKIAKVMRYSSLVIAGNRYLTDYANRAGAKKISIIPTVIDLSRYPKQYSKVINEKPVMGWIGSPSTVKYLYGLIPVLESVNNKMPFVLHVIGANFEKQVRFEVKHIPWTDQTEVVEMQKIDLGIMPLPDSPWERGKCGFKLIQYMGCSKPVIASPVGANKEIIERSVNGYLATTEEEWLTAILSLFGDSILSEDMGGLGRIKIEKLYNRDIVLPKLVKLLKNIANTKIK